MSPLYEAGGCVRATGNTSWVIIDVSNRQIIGSYFAHALLEVAPGANNLRLVKTSLISFPLDIAALGSGWLCMRNRKREMGNN